MHILVPIKKHDINKNIAKLSTKTKSYLSEGMYFRMVAINIVVFLEAIRSSLPRVIGSKALKALLKEVVP